MKKVIIIEDSPTFCNMLGKKLEAKGWKTILCYNYRDGLKTVRESSEWDVVISDMRLGNDNGIDLLEWMRSNGYQNPFIIMTSYDESMSAVRTMKLGAEDYIPKKLLLDVVYERLEEIIDKQKRLVELNNKIVYRKSEKFRRIYKMAELFAKSDMAVMILGDNGTGKEHIAEKIHLQSKRADKPFEVVDCGTLSAELAVSALFGHEKGAFTSADAARKGYFELAAGGTLFWTRLATCRKTYRRCCCVCCNPRATDHWELQKIKWLMCALLPPPTKTCKRQFGKDDSEATCIIDFTKRLLRFHGCGIARKILCH